MAEGVAERYRREYLELGDDRKVRGFDYRSEDRRLREYNETGDPAVNTTVDRFDNVPAGFDAQDFEAGLESNPNDPTPEPAPDAGA